MFNVKWACQANHGLLTRDQGIMSTLFEQVYETAHGTLFIHSFYKKLNFTYLLAYRNSFHVRTEVS